jgi:hypothetical protein
MGDDVATSAPRAEEPKVLVYPDRGSLWALAVMAFVMGGGAFVLAGLALADHSSTWTPAVLAGGFFGAGFINAAWRLASRAPFLCVSRDAIEHISIGRRRTIPVSSGAHVVAHESQGQRYVGLVPGDLRAFLREERLLTRVVMRVNVALCGMPVNIPETILSTTADDVVSRIHRLRETRPTL